VCGGWAYIRVFLMFFGGDFCLGVFIGIRLGRGIFVGGPCICVLI